MGRPGKIFDQDEDGDDPAPRAGPAGRRGLFDQDAAVAQSRGAPTPVAGRPDPAPLDPAPPNPEPPNPAPLDPEPPNPAPLDLAQAVLTGPPLLRISSSRRPPPLRPAQPDPAAPLRPAQPDPAARPRPAQAGPVPGARRSPPQPRDVRHRTDRNHHEPRRSGRSPGAPSDGQALASATVVMATGTLLSRATGFARVLLVATILGTTGLGDAYNLANSVPNIVYDLLLGGILSATLVPVFVKELSRPDEREATRAVNAVVSTAVVALVAISAALYLLAPVVLRFYLLFDHQVSKVDEQAVGASLLRLFAPQVLLLGAIVVTTALLNARRRFAVAAFSPVANNLVAIAALGTTAVAAGDLRIGAFRQKHGALLILGVGTTLGYLLQLAIQLPALRRAGIRLRPTWDPHHPAVRRVAGLSAWLIGTVVANQVAFNIILLYAARRPGDVTVYTTAYQFFQLPYALFTVSIASTLTPDLARRWSEEDRLGFARRMIRGLRVTLGILVPVAVGYAVVARPLIDLTVLHGRVTPAQATAIGSSLALFAVGLPGFSAFTLLLRAFQAMTDARTVFWLYVAENALTLVTAVALWPSMGVRGLAVAFVAPYTVVAVVAASLLRRRIGSLGGSLTVRALVRIAVAGAAMVGALAIVGRLLPGGPSAVALVARLTVEVIVGAVVYLGAARVLGIEELRPVLALAGRLRPFRRLA